MRKIIAVDFDGTLCKNAWPNIGKPKKNIIRKVKRLQKKGVIFILWTCREGEALRKALQWCREQSIPMDFANRNTLEMIEEFKNDSRKIGATEYWDDKARRIR